MSYTHRGLKLFSDNTANSLGSLWILQKQGVTGTFLSRVIDLEQKNSRCLMSVFKHLTLHLNVLQSGCYALCTDFDTKNIL